MQADHADDANYDKIVKGEFKLSGRIHYTHQQDCNRGSVRTGIILIIIIITFTPSHTIDKFPVPGKQP